MKPLDRITFNPEVMGGKPCIRGMRVTLGTLVRCWQYRKLIHQA